MTQPDSDLPFISVVMPIYNEVAFIERSLGAVMEQDYPAERMEVLVVDGLSQDGTRDSVAEVAAHDGRVRLLDNPDRDQASALNIGIRLAQGETIVRVDGHCLLPPHYLRTCVETLHQTGADNVGGQMRSAGDTLLTQAIAAATNTPFATGGARFHFSTSPGEVDTVYLGAFRRSVFDRAGLFDPTAVPNEDYELNYRIRRSGGRVVYNPDIWATYYVRPSLFALLNQYFRYGRRKADIVWRYPGSTRPRHLAMPAYVATLLGALVASPFVPQARWLALALAGAYLLGNLSVSFLTAARSVWHYLPWLPIIFGIIHLSWGTGFLVRLVALPFSPRRQRQ